MSKVIKSIHRVADLITEYYGEMTELSEFSAAEEGEKLRSRWVELCKSLQLPFRVTVLECVNPAFVVVLSDYSLFEGVSTKVLEGRFRNEYVEIKRETIEQHTFFWVATNPNGGRAIFTQIYQDKYYTRIDRRLEVRGMKKREMRIVPVLWVASSDGQIRKHEDAIRASLDREVPGAADIGQVRDILTATLTEEVLQTNELLVQEVEKKDLMMKKKERIDEARNKAIVAQALFDLKMTGKYQEVGFGSRMVNLISNKWMQIIAFIAFMYLVAAIVLNLIALVMHVAPPWGFPDWTPGAPETGGGDTIPDPATGGGG